MKFEVNERYLHRNLGTVTITNRVGNFIYAHPSWAAWSQWIARPPCF